MRPRGTELLTVEGEIAVIIGRRAHHVSPEEGAAHIGWFAPANDVGLYDMRWADRGSNLFSKGQDGFTPIGAPVPAEQLDLGQPDAAHARQRRGRAGGLERQPDLPASACWSPTSRAS